MNQSRDRTYFERAQRDARTAPTSAHALIKKCVTRTRDQFEDDVYIATSEPHGDIEATITRGHARPHAKLFSKL